MEKPRAKSQHSKIKDNNAASVFGLLDIDCFECQVLVNYLHPHLRGLPCVAISSNGKSCPKIASVNYETRAFGVGRSHTIDEALQLCPTLELVSLPRNEEKTDRSLLIQAASDVMQSLQNFSLNNFPQNNTCTTITFSPCDEFYIDLTQQIDPTMNLTDRLERGRSLMTQILNHVLNETGLTCSAGVSTSKFRAKLASEQNRPYAVSILHPDDWEEFLGSKEIVTVPGLKGKLGIKLVTGFGLRWTKKFKGIPENDLLEQGCVKGKELAALRRIFAGDF